MKRISFKQLGVFLGLLLIIGIITPLSVLADYTPSLTKNDGVYEISTPEQLESFRADLAATDATGYEGETVVLTADIDMTSQSMTNYKGEKFNGTFNGQGHTITLNQELESGYSLIPKNYGTLKNLNVVVNCMVNTDGGTNISPFCTYNGGDIRNVKVQGTIMVPAAIHNETSNKNVSIGGLIGNSKRDSVVEDCIASIDYKISGTEAEIDTYKNTIASISLYQLAVRPNVNSTIDRCFSAGTYDTNLKKIESNNESNYKVDLGIAGANFDDAYNCINYYDKERLEPYHFAFKTDATLPIESETQYVGKTTADLKTKATYTDWDFDVTWNIEEGNSYPFLTFKAAVPLTVKPIIADKAWNAEGDLSATVTGMAFEGLTEEQQAQIDKYGVTVNYEVASANFNRMQNMGSQAVTVEYTTSPSLTIENADQAETDGVVFKIVKVLDVQGKVVDNGAAGPTTKEQKDAQIAKAKEANTIIFEKFIGDGSAYLTPLIVNDSPAGEKEFLPDGWPIFSAARGGYVPGEDSAFYDKWFANVKTSLHSLKEAGLKKEDMKVTAWTKLVMAITAAGYDARDIEDYDLIDIISDKNMLDNNKVLQEQTAYLALLGGGYEMTAETPLITDPSAMAKASAEHLNSWSDLAVTNGDNAMYFQHLGFFLDDPDVKAATENYMYNRVGGDNPILQNGDGSFTTTGQPLNAYNNAQTMIALGCFNMNVFDDRFIQNGNTVLDSQFKFINFEERNYGDLRYEITQLTRGFTAVIRQYEGRNQIFDTSDIVGATKPVNDLLNALTSTSSTDDIKAAKDAYEALSDAKKASIGKVNQERITALGIVDLINNLPSASAEEGLEASDKADVMAVRAAYKALTSSQAQELVTNLSDLVAREEKIADLEKESSIKNDATGITVVGLPNTATALTITDKISNADLKKAAADAAAAQGLENVEIVTLYDIKPDMTPEDLEAFNSSTDSYVTIILPIPEGQQGAKNYQIYHLKSDGKTVEWITPVVSDDGKSLVFKVSSFSSFGVVKGLSADEIAAKVVSDQIDALPTKDQLKLTDETVVAAARAAFNKLSSEQQKLVANLAKLKELEAQITVLKNAGTGQTPGGETEEPKAITITVDVERFTIGQGFYVEPTTLSIKEGDTVRTAIEKLLGSGNLIGDVGYLRAIKGADAGSANIPQYIVDELNAGNSSAANAYGQSYTGSDLGEFDYSSYSGWMYFVNNNTPSAGIDQKKLNDGDVLRLAFTYWATGGDLTGSGYIGSGIDRTPISMSFTPANKDSLIKAIAKVNGNSAYLSDAAISEAYENAMTVVQDMTSSLVVTNTATNDLNKAISEYKPGGNTANDAKLAKVVSDQIAGLPAVTKLALTDKAAVAAARTAYDALTASQKKLVTNLSTLTAAEAKIAELLAGEATEADKAAAKTVGGQIAGLPSGDKLALGSKADVVAVRAAYNALTDIQKSLITNLDTLIAAEAKLAELEKVTPPVKDEATGIEAVGLPEGVGLKVEPETNDTDKTEAAKKAAQEADIKDAEIVSLYSIKPDMSDDDLAEFNNDPNSFVTLTLPVGDDQQGYNSYKIYHKKTDGTVEWITPTLSADGKSLIFKVSAFSDFGVVGTKASTEIPIVDFSYRTHVQNVGWQEWKNNGAMSGTQGRSLRLEGIEIKRTDKADVDLGIRYETHIENIGWEDSWKTDGTMSGTEGRSLRLEAIRIELTGADAENYDVYYQVHAQNTGWMAFAKNGEDAGTAGFGYRLEGIHIIVVPEGEAAPTPEDGSIETAFLVKN